MRYGYARVSTEDQNADIQVAELVRAGVERPFIRVEKKSGKSLDGRDELKILLDFMRQGDELVVSRLDRLGRSVFDLAGLVRDFEKRGINLKAIHENIDISTASGKLFIGILAVLGEYDYNLRRERQAAGIKAAKERGEYKGRGGRPPKVKDVLAVADMAKQVGPAALARQMGISRATIYRHIALANEAMGDGARGDTLLLGAVPLDAI